MSENKNNLKAAEVFKMADLVDYSDGAVVSRTISSKKAGTVTLFSFDAGQSLSEHSAPFDAIVHVIDGEAELVIDGQPIKTGAGEVVVMPANIPHAVNAIARFKMLLIMIKEQ